MKKDKIKICYIGGGSRNWAWVLMQDLAFEKDISGTIELFDIRHSDALINEAIGNRLMDAHNPGIWRFQANPSLPDALHGSDFVFISILPGDFDDMAVDVHVPENYGIYQSVGDSAGIGGIIRSLRTVPQFRKIAKEIKKHAPNAWVINYTNPMSVCTRTLYMEYPGIKAFGCCHEVFHTQKLLATVLEESGLAPAGSIKREDIKVNVLGLNHFTWIDKATWKNTDIFPIYLKFAEKYADTGFRKKSDGAAINEDELERQKLFGSTDRVKMNLFRRYGLIAAAGDRHLVEFCPHSWYLSSPEEVERWGYALTPVSWRIKDQEALKQKAIEYRDGTQVMTPVESGEEGLKIVKALLGLTGITTNVNFPNVGQMPDIPMGTIVETNANFKKSKIEPVAVRSLPSDIRALIMHHVLSQEGIVEAVFEDDMEKVFRIFSQDLEVQKLSLSDARSMFNEMYAKTMRK
ncbi:MAG: alpha-glucosidase/alpha-galactosidase [Treponema sp.]|nr:alpha-glucosidase/alpha-galactosidase [Treponema sp.]